MTSNEFRTRSVVEQMSSELAIAFSKSSGPETTKHANVAWSSKGSGSFSNYSNSERVLRTAIDVRSKCAKKKTVDGGMERTLQCKPPATASQSTAAVLMSAAQDLAAFSSSCSWHLWRIRHGARPPPLPPAPRATTPAAFAENIGNNESAESRVEYARPDEKLNENASNREDPAADSFSNTTNQAEVTSQPSEFITVSPREVFKMRLHTTKGEVVLEVHPEWAPIGAARFKLLVDRKFYDGSKFFDIRPGDYVVFGAHEPDKGFWGTIEDEPAKKANLRGFVAFASTDQPSSQGNRVKIHKPLL